MCIIFIEKQRIRYTIKYIAAILLIVILYSKIYIFLVDFRHFQPHSGGDEGPERPPEEHLRLLRADQGQARVLYDIYMHNM